MQTFVLAALMGVAVAAEPEAQVMTVVERPDGVELIVRLPDIRVTAITNGGREFTMVELPGAGATGEPGHPMLPVYRQLVEVPFGAELTVSAEPAAFSEVHLGFPPAPRQPSVPKSGPAPGFAFDAKVYATDEWTAKIGARIVEVGEMRGHRLALLEVSPVSCNPARNLLRFTREMRVSVFWSGADHSLTQVLRRRYDSPVFAGRLRGIVANPDQFSLDGPPALPIGYLVIVPDAWEGNVRRLAEWRRRRGYNVCVRNLTQVGGGQASAVKAYIQNAYDNWPVPPSMVLLVGDVDRIGCFPGQGEGSPPTDLNFGLVAGSDYLPDIDVSRASVVTAEQLDSLVSKTIRYEQNLWGSGTGWLKKAYFIASSDGGNHQVAEGTHQYCMRKLRAHGVICDSLWLYYGSGTPITTAVDSGRAWVTYSGHGGENSWADPNFTNGDVHQLTNADLVPFVQTYACLSGNFASSSYPECFSEAWIRNGLRGAICHVASTVTSYWTEDDTLQRRVFDYMFDSTYAWVAGGFNRAKLKYYQQMGANATTRRYLEMYNYIGDGAIDVYSQEPIAISVAHPPVIPLGVYPMHVSVTSGCSPVPNALVALTGRADTSVFASGYTDAGGTATLTITTVVPDSVCVTVTGHNLAPYLGVALALPSSGPYVMLLRHSVDDSAGGNNDRIVNPGETINLPVWLKNWGSAGARNTRAWLRAIDPSITLLDTVRDFGTIAAGDSACTGPAGYRFSVAPSCTNGYVLRFNLVARDAADSVWTSALSLTVGAPVLQFAASRAEDPPPGGNGNGMLEPGEAADLIVTLRNTGLGHAYGVTAVLRSGNPRLVVLDSVGNFGNIIRDTTGSNEADKFRVAADSAIPRETQVSCTLEIRAGSLVYVRVFSLGIGILRTCDPIPDGPRTPAQYYAYDVTDTLYTEAPVFNWVEIRGLGTRLTLADDQTAQVNLPTGFGPWVFYGQRYTQVSICGNGWVAPGYSTSATYLNTVLPNSSMPPAVFLNWDDLYPPTGNGVWYYHDAANRRFIVEWDSVHYYNPRAQWDKSQVIIYDTTRSAADGNSEIVFQYLTANRTSSATVGEQDPTRAIAIQALFDDSYHRGAAPLEAGMAIKFTTDSPRIRVGLAESGTGQLRRALELVSCAPNPVRGVGRVVFSVPSRMVLSLGVYDITGRRVAELFGGVAEPGLHMALWDGKDQAGREVGHGVYFYRLEAASSQLTRKVTMVR